MKSNHIKNLVCIAVIASTYTIFTIINPLSFGSVQIRFSEIFTILSTVTPLAITGLTLGCFISNLTSFIPFDCVFGSLATLLACVCSYLLRNKKIKGLPVLSAFMPVVFNGIIVAGQLCFYCNTFTLEFFCICAVEVAVGETVSCAVGLVLYPFFKRFFNNITLKC